jgi:cation transport ATPase
VAVEKLNAMGVQVAMLTGDNRATGAFHFIAKGGKISSRAGQTKPQRRRNDERRETHPSGQERNG